MFFLKKRKNHSCRQWKERTPEIFSSVQLRRSVVSNSATPGVAASQASLFITDSRTLPKPMSAESVMPSSHLVLCRPFSSCPQSRPASGLFSSESPLHIRWPQDSRFSLSVRPSRTDLLQDGLAGSPRSPRDFQQSSPTPQCESINSSALSFLHRPTLTSIHDYWKNHSLH